MEYICRSSNLVYAITCTRCDIQYVGQALLRVNDKFVHHFYDVDKCNHTKPVGKHFSHMDHNGILYMTKQKHMMQVQTLGCLSIYFCIFCILNGHFELKMAPK